MSLIKKIDVKEHLAAKRRMRLVAARHTSLPDATGFSGIEPPGAPPAARRFVEDSLGKHASLSAPAGAVRVVGESEGDTATVVPESR